MTDRIRVSVRVKMVLKTSSHAPDSLRLAVQDKVHAMSEWAQSRQILSEQTVRIDDFRTYERSGTIFSTGEIILTVYDGEAPYGDRSKVASDIVYDWAERYAVGKREIIEIMHDNGERE